MRFAPIVLLALTACSGESAGGVEEYTDNCGAPRVDASAVGALVDAPLRLAQGWRLRSIEATVRGPTGHRSGPQSLPSFALIDADASDTLGTAIDHSAAPMPYELDHVVALDFQTVKDAPELATDGRSYAVRFSGEAGNGAVPGLAVAGWSCRYGR